MKQISELAAMLMAVFFVLVFIGIPTVVTAFQLLYFFAHCCKMDLSLKPIFRLHKLVEIITIIAGIIELKLYLELMEVTEYDWYEQAINNQVHTPVATWTYPTVFAWFGVGLCGYLILRYISVKKLPPLILTGAMAFLYIGCGVNVLWMVQTFELSPHGLILCLYPLNLCVIALSTIVDVVNQWKQMQEETENSSKKWTGLRKWVYHTMSLPLAAFILMIPCIGILIMVLTLFGQTPDAIIQAWTQTSEWNLSHQVSPQNIYQDEHYLCTVAAGGHRKIVKPKRMGVRHGHKVIVNRQLCVANAFEQVLEEKLPSFHRGIRHVYDTYGYPVARHIHSPYMADFIYILMKPLEWIFLVVLYIVDTKPENRIAMQYILPLPKQGMAAAGEEKSNV